ncbi:MAG TPA: hypothetical protein DCE41_11775 [Cytophagales bacterium]|nr:hypothetical protein [Cytophagales bacterium]HAA18101.1 hypothetical protein [Cytophagales bacterium]HAP61872.1 hypothetical protein [Cytophagales bacterium]
MKLSTPIILILLFVSTFLLSVSVGANAVIIPVFVEGDEAFDAFSKTLILSMEAFVAIGMSLALPRLLRRIGIRATLFAAAGVRIGASGLMSWFTDVPNWILGSLCLGGGTFLYLLLIQICLSNVEIRRKKGLIYSLFGVIISLGIAVGPLALEKLDALLTLSGLAEYVANLGLPAVGTQLIFSALLTAISLLPFFLGRSMVPPIQEIPAFSVWKLVRENKDVLFAVALCGISFMGVSWYITIYGLHSGLKLNQAPYLLSAFMLGSICLDTPLSFLAEYVNRKVMLVLSALLCSILAIFIPLAIYDFTQACALLFVWGGLVSGMYSNCLVLLELKYKNQNVVATNTVFSLMENIGGAIGLTLIGIFLQEGFNNGFSYLIIAACLVYFTLVLNWYKPN